MSLISDYLGNKYEDYRTIAQGERHINHNPQRVLLLNLLLCPTRFTISPLIRPFALYLWPMTDFVMAFLQTYVIICFNYCVFVKYNIYFLILRTVGHSQSRRD